MGTSLWRSAPVRKEGPAADEAGFTLIELMISLGLFALIAAAGLTMVTGIINVQTRTESRLDRLAQLQRAMFAVTSDLDQVAAGPISGRGGEISFTRAAPGAGGPATPVRYSVAGGALIRNVGPLPQMVLPGVASAQWRFRDSNGWVDRWPVREDEADRWPRAVEVRMALAGPGGASGGLRRVIVLPVQPPKEQQP